MQHDTPEFEKRWKRYARFVGGSWRCDETIKVKGAGQYLYRASDKAGKTVDFPNRFGGDSGIELAEKIKKGQFKIGKLGGTAARMPEIWRAALAA